MTKDEAKRTQKMRQNLENLGCNSLKGILGAEFAPKCESCFYFRSLVND